VSGSTLAAGRDVFVGRQPIYDRQFHLFAYELLFRGSEENEARVVDGDEATFTVMLNALVEIGLGRLVGQHRAFINVTRNSLLCQYPQFFPKDQVVLEVLEDVKVDEELLDMMRLLAAQGYLIALDDFEDAEEIRPLLDLASIIKMDIQALGPDRLKDQVQRFQRFRLLAEKVETREQFEYCKSLGFDLFQGYFLCRPKVVAVRHVPTSQLATLRLLAKIHDPAVEPEALAEIIAQDVSLTYRLIRTVNSAYFAPPVPIESVAQAVRFLGIKRISSWVTLLTISGVDDSPLELMSTAMVRAKMCELLAPTVGCDLPHKLFLIGLFSVLEGLLGGRMDELLDTLPLSPDIALALIRGEGPAGRVLSCVLAYERGDWNNVTLPGVDDATIREAYLTSIVWADEARAMMGF
jgi:EAL and modified HD-GYP domain-containing signal transduction protein